MTSQEIVKKAILFEGPERIPYDLPPEWGTDFTGAAVGEDPGWTPKVKTETRWEDEWGSIWEKPPGDKTMGQVRYHLLADYKDMASYRFPDYKNPARYVITGKEVAGNKDRKFVLAGIPLSLIHRLEYLRGHEAAWTDPYLHQDEFEHLLDRFADVAIDCLENLAKAGVDGVISCDDWGLQDRLMVRPETWRKFWKPRYAKVYGYAHEKGILTFLHSCGYTYDIIGDLKEAGLDVIQLDQQENMGVDKLAAAYGGKICFWSPVDIQNTMAKGSVDDVRRYAKHLIDAFGSDNGGFIAKWYPSPAAVNHSEEKIRAMSETFVEYGTTFYPPKTGCCCCKRCR